jgi:hypothetical protein
LPDHACLNDTTVIAWMPMLSQAVILAFPQGAYRANIGHKVPSANRSQTSPN